MYCRTASDARWPVSGFFSSAVATGRPLTASVTSMMQRRFFPSGRFNTEVNATCRVMVSRFVA